MSKYSVLLAALIMSSFAHALPCESVYRQAYEEFSLHNKVSLQEAGDIYLMHFDNQNGIAQVYEEARPLFKLLGTLPENEDRTLDLLSEKILDGTLCPNGRALGLQETAALLSAALKN